MGFSDGTATLLVSCATPAQVSHDIRTARYTISVDNERRYVTMNLRLMKWLRDALGKWAERNHRSVTAEIIHRLERSIRADERKQRD